MQGALFKLYMASYNVPEHVLGNSFPEIWSILRNLMKDGHERPLIMKAIASLLSRDPNALNKQGTKPAKVAPGLLYCLHHDKLASALDIAFDSPAWEGFGVKGHNMGFWRKLGLKHMMGV
jgi:hypothetical protein